MNRGVSARGALPVLPETTRRWFHTTGEVRRSGDTVLVVLPYAPPLRGSRGRRYRVGVHDHPSRVRVVVDLNGRAALLLPAAELGPTDRVALRLRAIPPPRRRRLPDDLAHALRRHGLALDRIPPHEVDQLLLLVTEASSPDVRAQRVAAAVTAVEARSRRGDV